MRRRSLQLANGKSWRDPKKKHLLKLEAPKCRDPTCLSTQLPTTGSVSEATNISNPVRRCTCGLRQTTQNDPVVWTTPTGLVNKDHTKVLVSSLQLYDISVVDHIYEVLVWMRPPVQRPEVRTPWISAALRAPQRGGMSGEMSVTGKYNSEHQSRIGGCPTCWAGGMVSDFPTLFSLFLTLFGEGTRI